MPLTEEILKSMIEGLHQGDICDIRSDSEPCDIKELVAKCNGKYEVGKRTDASNDSVVNYTSVRRVR